jgi:4-hydroxy-2-oxoheptanedioate aldolase
MRLDKLMSFREKLGASAVDGVFFKSNDPAFVEAAGHTELDFAILDMEHGPADFKAVENLVRAAESSSMLPIVRTSANEPWMISRALDTGAAGVQVPNISSAKEAKQAIESARFYPNGSRGVCRFVRAAEYGDALKANYFAESNETILVLMVEGQQGLEDLDLILNLENFDILFIGPYDLSQSLGIPGDIYNPIIQDHLKEIVVKAERKGKQVGTFYDELERRSWFISCGVHYLSYSVDTEIFRQACSKIKNSND